MPTRGPGGDTDAARIRKTVVPPQCAYRVGARNSLSETPRAPEWCGNRVFRGLGRGARPNTEPFLETPWVGCPLADRAAQWGSPRSASMPDRVPEEDAEAGAHRDCENLMPSCSRGRGAYVHVECRIMTVKFCVSEQKS